MFASVPQCPSAWESSECGGTVSPAHSAVCNPGTQYLIVHKVVSFNASWLCSPWWLHRNHSASQETKPAQVQVFLNGCKCEVQGAPAQVECHHLSSLHLSASLLDGSRREGTQRRGVYEQASRITLAMHQSKQQVVCNCSCIVDI